MKNTNKFRKGQVVDLHPSIALELIRQGKAQMTKDMAEEEIQDD